MKISCQSCNAKYTIADEKVVGKIVKIRCKKCGATIVINGNEAGTGVAPAPDDSNQDTRVFDYTSGQGGTGEQWTVNVSDGDQRTMTVAEIAAEVRAGVIHDETFCWREGMNDWLPLREIGELYSAVQTGPRPSLLPEQASTEDTAAAAAGGGLFGGSARPGANGNAMGALFGSGPPAAAASSAPAAARRAGGRAGADLFGGVEHAGGEQDVMTSAPKSQEDAKLTGQRNENSVLFSLAALTKDGPKEQAPAAQGEGSGLIDIRALASATAQKPAGSGAKVDDIMNLAGGGAFSPALAAPVLAPPSLSGPDLGTTAGGTRSNQKMLIIAILIAAALISASIMVFALTRKSEPEAGAGAAAAGAANTAAGASTQATAAATPAATNEAPPAATTATTTAAPPGTGASAHEPSHDRGETAARGGGSKGGAAKAGGGKAGGLFQGVETAAPTPPPAAPAAAAPKGLDQAMAESAGSKPKPAAAAAESSSPFDRGAAAAALGAAAAAVGSCKKPDGPTGGGHVKVTFQPNGTVSTVEVDQPPYSGTAVGGCVAAKFRGARVPAFAGSPVSVGKSFTIN